MDFFGLAKKAVGFVTGSAFSFLPYVAGGAALVAVAFLYNAVKSSGRSEAEAGFVRAELASQQEANDRLLGQVARVEALNSEYRVRDIGRMERAANVEARLRSWQDENTEPGQCSPDCLLPPWLLEESP